MRRRLKQWWHRLQWFVSETWARGWPQWWNADDDGRPLYIGPLPDFPEFFSFDQYLNDMIRQTILALPMPEPMAMHRSTYGESLSPRMYRTRERLRRQGDYE